MKVLNGEEVLQLPDLDNISFSDTLYKIRTCSKDVNYMLILQLHITDYCNLKCNHCYGMSKKTEMSMMQFTKVIDDFFYYIKRHKLAARIHLTGGEPLVHEHFYEMLEYLWDNYFINKYPFVIEILTNGTILNEDTLKRIEQYREMIFEIQLSVDGMEKVHNYIRGNDTWKKTVKATRLLKENQYRVSWSFVISKKNYFDAIEVLHLAEEMQVDRMTISRLIPLGMNADEARSNILSIDEYKEVQKNIYDAASLLFERLREGKTTTYLAMNRCDLWNLADQEYIKQQLEMVQSIPSYMVLGCACMIGKNYMVILPNGDMLACRRLPQVIGNVYENTIGEIWRNSEFLKAVRLRYSKMEGKCKECEFYSNPALRNLCGGGGPCMAVAQGHTIYSPDPMCWK